MCANCCFYSTRVVLEMYNALLEFGEEETEFVPRNLATDELFTTVDLELPFWTYQIIFGHLITIIKKEKSK